MEEEEIIYPCMSQYIDKFTQDILLNISRTQNTRVTLEAINHYFHCRFITLHRINEIQASKSKIACPAHRGFSRESHNSTKPYMMK
ncbi:hypothetical protein ABKN59_011861 [Abortiporus biennis]